jgi:hypothetical protein
MDFWDKAINTAAGDSSFGWFSLYNALGVQYHLTEKLNLWFEAGNKFSLLKTTVDKAVRKDTYNVFGASAKAVYTFSPNLSVEGGVAVYNATYIWNINDKNYDSIPEQLYDGSTNDLTNVTTNQFVVQVPLRLKILF